MSEHCRHFSRVLVANRNEIASRVLRTLHQLGYSTVAVCSQADLTAPYIQLADSFVLLDGLDPAAAYLNIQGLIAAAKQSGADAIHPGYGFLAENADFAKECVQAGLVFIGPTAESIRKMGDKAEGKKVMKAAGLPCIPGYEGEDEQDLWVAANQIGYPILIKPRAGGGGKGMHLVSHANELLVALESTRLHAGKLFADQRIILERALFNPRHIEVQIFADSLGNVVHLGERECSVQRRHQKLIEESPSPAVSPEKRRLITTLSVEAIQKIGYIGAGTLEFLMDEDGYFYFIEMNTRLQVEHPVTEFCTGLDLVEWQIRVARGEPLPKKQSEIHFRGHAIEVRLCAEDPQQDFLPQSGTLLKWLPSSEIRVDEALADDYQVPHYYDSLLAKMVVHAEDRGVAIQKMVRGLEQSVLMGIKTNQGFLWRCLQHPQYKQGLATTAFIPNYGHELKDTPKDSIRLGLYLAAIYPFLQKHTTHFLKAKHPRWRYLQFEQDYFLFQVQVQDGFYQVDTLDNKTKTILDSQPIMIHQSAQTHQWYMATHTHFTPVWLLSSPETPSAETKEYWLQIKADTLFIRDIYLNTGNTSLGSESNLTEGTTVYSQISGKVVKIHCSLGDEVSLGQNLVTVEAMKMEHNHLARISGTVSGISIAVGNQTHKGDVLLFISPKNADPSATS
ncbi:MAG: biotin carboxylase N-terminal domain-containing protein [Gammaproteobacteria bacterium]|nr:biotin carboxylase N-terminal domain-containing protein [Gammaproteobacteria bacterium]